MILFVKDISWGFGIYHLTFGDKSVRVLCLHIWKNQKILKTLKAELSFQIFKKSLSDWFGPTCKCKINSYLNNYSYNTTTLWVESQIWSILFKFFIVNYVHLELFCFELFFYPRMNKLNIDTSVSKMGLTTASAPLASIIRAKLWKVVIVSSFLTSGPFFSKCIYLR